MTLRRPNPIRSLRQAKEDQTTYASRTSYLEDLPQTEMLEQYLPQIREESLQASKTARTVFYYYRKKLSGRKCTCFEIETSPDANCQICYGSGIVGGWDMHGCRTEIIDTTYPKLKLVNVIADYKAGRRPVTFALEGNALKGFIIADIPLLRNVRKTQMIQEVVGGIVTGNGVKSFIKAPNETTWVELTNSSLEARLGYASIQVKIEVSRKNVEIPSPRFSHLLVRYQMIPEVKMFGNMALSEESFAMGDLGFTDSFSTLTIYVPASFDHLRTEDFLVRTSDMKRFKLTMVSRNVVSEMLLSTTITSRLLVRGNDSLVNFP